MSLWESMLKNASLLIFVSHGSWNLLEPDETLEDALMVIFVLRDLNWLHHGEQRLVKLAKSESNACEIQCRVVYLHSPADKLEDASFRIWFCNFRAHLVIKITM